MSSLHEGAEEDMKNKGDSNDAKEEKQIQILTGFSGFGGITTTEQNKNETLGS